MTPKLQPFLPRCRDFQERLLTHTIPDADDDAMKRYKESLGIGGGGKDLSDPNDPRHCIILSLTMNTAGRDPVTINLTAPGALNTLKDHPFKIKEGAKFTMETKFKVQHQILSGLHYVQIVKRKGIRVSKDQEMLVSPPPRNSVPIEGLCADGDTGLLCTQHRQDTRIHKAL